MRFLRTQAGDTYNADAVDKTVDDLTMQLAKDGNPFATVTAHSNPLPGRRLVDVTYAIEDGRHVCDVPHERQRGDPGNAARAGGRAPDMRAEG